MSVAKKTKQQLIDELQEARTRITELESSLRSLTRDQELLQILLDTVPNITIYFKDLESRFIRISQAKARRHGLGDPAEAVGKTDFDFFTDEHARQAFEDEQGIIRTGRPLLSIEERETWPDRPDTWVTTTKLPMRDGEGDIIGTFGISTDITELKQAQDKLDRERNLLHTLIDSLPDYIYIKDTESRFIMVNEAQARIAGAAAPDDLVGKTDFDFYPQELARKYYTDEQQILQSGQPLINAEEMAIDQRTGETKWLLTSKIPFRDSRGKIAGIVGLGRDITEHTHLLTKLKQRSTQLLTASEISRAASSILEPAALIQQAVDLILKRFDLYYAGLFLVDETGAWAGEPGRWAVLRAGTGEAGQRMLAEGHKLEIGGTSMVGWCVANKRARIALDVGQEAVRFENPLLPDTHSEMALPLISRGEIVGALTIQSTKQAAFAQEDITVLQTMADQLANTIANARLYDRAQREITERKRAEEALKRQAEELTTSLQQFAYVASHDLQQPLRQVASYAQLLQRRYAGRLDEDADEFIAYAVEGATRMRHLINDLLAYWRVTATVEPFRPVDCDFVLGRVLATLRGALAESGTTVTHDPLPTVMGSASQLGQAFRSLIDNALKFRGDRPLEIHIGVEQSDGEWLFSFHDNGIGISSQYHQRIFALFQRLHSGEKYPGTGAGLAICKRIIERHGGRIWVESEQGAGATFYLTIPGIGGNS